VRYSPDPYIQAPLFSQSFNRYSYVFNNPLRYTDPSGFLTSERVTYYDSWYGGYVSRDFAAGTPASSFSPDIGWGTLEGYFESLHGRSITPINSEMDDSEYGAGGESRLGPMQTEGASLETIVRAVRYAPPTGQEGMGGQLLLLYYRWTQTYRGILYGAVQGALPFSSLLPPPPDNMSDEARIGYYTGLSLGVTAEFLGGVFFIAKGLGEGGSGLALGFGSGGVAASGSVLLAAEAAASVSLGIIVIAHAAEKAKKVIELVVMSEMSGDDGGDSTEITIGGRPWRAHKVSDEACASGCEDVAQEIQSKIGGEIKTIEPKGRIPMLGRIRDRVGAPFERPGGGEWFFHKVVIKGDRVFDLLTGWRGQSIPAYKRRWEYPEAIEWPF